jgi:uncharacterized protein with NRDE domain
VGIELERILSPRFISAPTYGTRSSTIILIDREKQVNFIEKTYNGQPEETKIVTFQFGIEDGMEKSKAIERGSNLI